MTTYFVFAATLLAQTQAGAASSPAPLPRYAAEAPSSAENEPQTLPGATPAAPGGTNIPADLRQSPGAEAAESRRSDDTPQAAGSSASRGGDIRPGAKFGPPLRLSQKETSPKAQQTAPPSLVPERTPTFVPQTVPTFVPEATPRKRIDSQVVPASGELVAVNPTAKASFAVKLIRSAMTPPQEEAIAGESLSLVELLAEKSHLQARHYELLRAYWQLLAAQGEYHWALENRQRIALAVGPRGQDDLLDAAIKAAIARVQLTKLTAIEAQYDLAQLRGMAVDTALPLPGNRPIVGAYRTYYETIVKTRPLSHPEQHRAKRLDATLPIAQEAIRTAGDEVEALEKLAVAAATDFAENRISSRQLIAAQDKLAAGQSQFLALVRDYNIAIAEYAMIAATSSATPSDLLPMISKMPAAQARTVSPVQNSAGSAVQNGVLPAGGIVPQDGTQPLLPATSQPPRSIIVDPRVTPSGANIPLDLNQGERPAAANTFSPQSSAGATFGEIRSGSENRPLDSSGVPLRQNEPQSITSPGVVDLQNRPNLAERQPERSAIAPPEVIDLGEQTVRPLRSVLVPSGSDRLEAN